MKYSVLTYIMGDGECVHEIKEKDPEAEYIMVTDNPNLTSSTWDVVYDESLSGTVFNRVFEVRYNPFKYVPNDIVIKIDGSMEVCSSLQPIVDKFAKDNYEMSLLFHPTRSVLYDEYVAWANNRQYPIEQANKVLNFLARFEGYDVQHYKGLVQLNYSIQKNDKVNNDINRMTYAFLKYLAPTATNIDNDIDRLDQTIFSFVLNKYFNQVPVMFFDERLCHSKFFLWYPHNSYTPFAFGGVETLSKPFAFNKPYHNQFKPDDF